MKAIVVFLGIFVALYWQPTVSRANGTITEVKPVQAGLELKTWTVIGNRYQLQCSTNLVEGGWTDLGSQITAVKTATNLSVNAEADHCWFRVVEEQADAAGPTSPPKPPARVPSGRPVRES
ncbi:hypothetical protein EGM51_15790 [Verrucomicrobia bacterium S94]|nr:hypothetical protein EGM51_15790 [Verrucomicrobia bacterium S94]